MGRQLGYRLIYVDERGINAFFVREDLLTSQADYLTLEALHPSPSALHKSGGTQFWERRSRMRVNYWEWSRSHGLPTFGLPPQAPGPDAIVRFAPSPPPPPTGFLASFWGPATKEKLLGTPHDCWLTPNTVCKGQEDVPLAP